MRYTSHNTKYSSTFKRAGEAFLRGMPWKHYPLYVGASVLAAWLGMLTLAFLSEHSSGDVETGEDIVLATKLLAYIFILHPLLMGVLEVRREFWGDGS